MNNETKHTPGKWRVAPFSSEIQIVNGMPEKPLRLTNRILLEHVQVGKVWWWAVKVDNRAPELFRNKDDAIMFARGVDIGQACCNDKPKWIFPDLLDEDCQQELEQFYKALHDSKNSRKMIGS